MAQSTLLLNEPNFSSKLNSSFDFNFNQPNQPSMKKGIETASSEIQVTQKNSKTSVCGICMKESLKDDLISCSDCGLGGKLFFVNHFLRIIFVRFLK